jgi:hypothetical protein
VFVKDFLRVQAPNLVNTKPTRKSARIFVSSESQAINYIRLKFTFYKFVCISQRKKDKKRIPVSVIMSKDIVTLNHTDDLLIAEKLFKKHQIR